MNKKYKTPAIQVKEIRARHMLAESLNAYNQPIDGGRALIKENNTWDDFGEEY